MSLLETQLVRKIWLGNFWKNFLCCSVVRFPHGNIQAQCTGKGRTTDSAMQFLKYAYTLSYFSIKAQMYLKFNIPETIYRSCSFCKRVNSGFRLCLWGAQSSGLAELRTWLLKEKLPYLHQKLSPFKTACDSLKPLRLWCKFSSFDMNMHPFRFWAELFKVNGPAASKCIDPLV